MAKYVIAGKSNCPFFAKAELLADELEARLIDFKVSKIVINPDDWNDWVRKTCAERKWAYDGRSPMIWRELIDRGGKGILVGSCSDFLEIASGYYGIKSNKNTDELLKISEENKQTKIKVDSINKARKERSNPLKICITGASNDTCYHCLVGLSSLKIFPAEQEISICLLDDVDKSDLLMGSCMELLDCATNQLKNIFATSNQEKAFSDAKLIIILNELNTTDRLQPNTENLDEFLKEHDFSYLKQYGEHISKVAEKEAKVLVAGGNANLACNMLIAASGLNNQNFFALSRLHENRSKSFIARRLSVKTADIQNVILFGQPFYSQFIDVSLSRVVGYDGAIWGPHIPGFSQDTQELVHDEKWMSQQLAEMTIQKPIDLQEVKSSTTPMSYAAAILDQLHDIFNGSQSDEIFSIGIASKGWYDVPDGLVFSFPVRFTENEIQVVTSLEIDEKTSQKLKEISTTLKSQTDAILALYDLKI